MQGERASRSLSEMRIDKTTLLEVKGGMGVRGGLNLLVRPVLVSTKNAPTGGSIKCQERYFCREREAALQEKMRSGFFA